MNRYRHNQGRRRARLRRWVPLCLALAVVAGCRPEEEKKQTQADDFDKLMNLSKAYIENRDTRQAMEVTEKALKLRPESPPALRNLVRVRLLSLGQEGLLEAAERAEKAEPQSVAGQYLHALALMRMSEFQRAAEKLESAVRDDPATATLRYQLAKAYEAIGESEKAIEQVRETVRLDPLFASAIYKLAREALRGGDTATWERLTVEWEQAKKALGVETQSDEALEQCRYTVPEGAEAAVPLASTAVPPAIEVKFVAEAAAPDLAAVSAGVIDVTESGAYRLVALEPDGTVVLRQHASNGWQRTETSVKLADPAAFVGCTVANFHDDVPADGTFDPAKHALNDCLFFGKRLALLKRTGADSFADVTEPAGLSEVSARDATWFDYDHDGDVDLVLAGEDRADLWQNNGNATFSMVTGDVGLADTGPAVACSPIEFDQTPATDLIVARGEQPTLVFRNQRAGRFAPLPEPPGPWPPALHVLTDDLDNDGTGDAVLITPGGATIVSGQSGTKQEIAWTNWTPRTACLIDYDNDGRLDLLAAGTNERGGTLRLFRNGSQWTEVSAACGLEQASYGVPRGLVAGDFDNDGDSDVLFLAGNPQIVQLRNEGGNRYRQLKVRLVGTKSNPTGIGARVEVRRNAGMISRFVGALPIEIGTGSIEMADTLQMQWTNGVIDNQVGVKIGSQPLTIKEVTVATGSCPFLYVWDGSRYRFVTDLLGNSPVGLSLKRDVLLPADPDEIVFVGSGESVGQRDGAYEFVVTSEFREVLYLDYAQALVADYPAGIEIHPTDKLMPPPFPESDLWGLANRRPLVSAMGDDGQDRTAALAQIDGKFAEPGRPLQPNLRGMGGPLAITLDFGPLPRDSRLVLALTGWLQYGDASTNIALSQNPDVPVIPPTLEVESSDGTWQKLDVVVGMPAGKTKSILCELPADLPGGSRKLRLTTTFEIRWDRIALFGGRAFAPSKGTMLQVSQAELYWRGFSELKSRAPGHPTTPDFDVVAEYPPWRTTLEGWCTRYGDVTELLAARDERLVLINGGDAIRLRFEAGNLPELPAGWQRSVFFYSVGWDKDGDNNVVDGDRVAPLPVKITSSTEGSEDWRVRYNTRWVPGDRFVR